MARKVAFSATSPANGRELYLTDGTDAGTTLVDVNPGAGSSNPGSFFPFGGKTLFQATSGSGIELWITDGTVAGTKLLKDINVGGDSAPGSFTQLNDKVIFAATGAEGRELWVTDGTVVGTKLLADIEVGGGSSNPTNLVTSGNLVYFQATQTGTGGELWATDGTAAGTRLVKDINANTTATSISGALTAGYVFIPSGTSSTFAYKDVVLFAANDGINGLEPWISDGTAAGTFLLANIATGAASSSPTRFTSANGGLVFAASTTATGIELYTTDGTTAGTRLVDLNPGTPAGLGSGAFTAFDGAVYLAGIDPIYSTELYEVRSSLTDFSTGATSFTVRRLTDINTAGSSVITQIAGHANPGQIGVLFGANPGASGTTGFELYRFNISNETVSLVKDITVGAGSSTISQVHTEGSSDPNGDNRVFFTTTTADAGSEPWVTDGTDAGTYRIKDIVSGTGSSAPTLFSDVLNLPVTTDDAATTAENATKVIGVLANDPSAGTDAFGRIIRYIDGQQVVNNTAQVYTLPSGATVTQAFDGTITYNPNGKFDYLVSSQTAATNPSVYAATATDTFTYSYGGAAAIVTVTITGVDAAGDQARGSASNDTITFTDPAKAETVDISQGGSDTVNAGGGDDGVFVGAALDAGDAIDGGAGIDQVGLFGSYSGSLGNVINTEFLAVLSGTSTRFGGDGTARFAYTLVATEATVAAGTAYVVQANELVVGENLSFDGSAETNGSFKIYLGKGNDVIVAGSGADGIFLGEGGRFTAADAINGGAGDDQLALRGNYTVTFAATTVTNVETIVLQSASGSSSPEAANYAYNLTLNDATVGAGQTLTVNAAQLRSGEVASINGSAETNGRFVFVGGAGNDGFTGGSGADTLFGGVGADTLTGGLGNDIFMYRTIADSTVAIGGRDTITDFRTGDLIDLSVIDAVTGGSDNAFSFIGSAAFTNGAAGQLRATLVSGSIWLVQGDVNGDGTADFAISVTTDHAIVATDFIL